MDIDNNELTRLMAQNEVSQAPYDHSDIPPDIQKKIKNLIDGASTRKERTWAWYQKLRKDDPQKYEQEKKHMLRDAVNLGDSFKDGDWQDRNFY